MMKKCQVVSVSRDSSVEEVVTWIGDVLERAGSFDVKRRRDIMSVFRDMEICGEMLLDLREEDLEDFPIALRASEKARLWRVLERGSDEINVVDNVNKPEKIDLQNGARVSRDSSVEDVVKWIRDVLDGADGKWKHDVVRAFRDMEICGEMLFDLREEDLEDFPCVLRESERGRLLHALNRLSEMKTKEKTRTRRRGSPKHAREEGNGGNMRALRTLSVSEFATWLRGFGTFDDFANVFEAFEIHGSMAGALCMDDADDFPELRRRSDWRARWKNLIKIIAEALRSGVRLSRSEAALVVE